MSNARHPALLLAICLLAPLPTLAADEGRIGATPPSTEERADDATINGRVEAMLSRATDVDASNVTAKTRNGVVHLEGDVASNADLRRIQELTADVDGVTTINNRLGVSR